MQSATIQVHVHGLEATAKIPGYSNPKHPHGDWELFLDLFPIHGACSKILQATLSRRLEQPHVKDLPTTLTQIHESLVVQDRKNRDPSYVCWSGPESAQLWPTMGISWPHGYFGAEQFWGDGFEIERDEDWEVRKFLIHHDASLTIGSVPLCRPSKVYDPTHTCSPQIA